MCRVCVWLVCVKSKATGKAGLSKDPARARVSTSLADVLTNWVKPHVHAKLAVGVAVAAVGKLVYSGSLRRHHGACVWLTHLSMSRTQMAALVRFPLAVVERIFCSSTRAEALWR